MAMETNVISLFIYYNGQLLQRQDRQNMSDFIISFNTFGGFDNFDQPLRLGLSGRVALTTPADGS